MSSAPHALEADWLGACRTATAELRRVLHDRPTTRERVEETGTRGEGGDRTLVIDERAEDAVFDQLELLHARGARFTAISEERGEADFGGGDVRVVIDPLDGSLNAKRGLPAHGISIAVADGPTMADVAFGFVHDFGTGEEWVASRGRGVLLSGEPLPEPPGERRDDEGRLEVVAIESADPRWIAAAAGELAEVAYPGLVPGAPLPPPEAVDRQLWADINLSGMRRMLDPVVDRLERGRSGMLGGPLRGMAGALLGLEVGGLTGLLSQRVLGQYELVLLDPDSRTRLLFLAPNLREAAGRLGVDLEQLVAWVGFHEVTHAVQFTSVPWLREHLAGLLRELLESVDVEFDL